jgi:hypothetical protein
LRAACGATSSTGWSRRTAALRHPRRCAE